MFLGFVYISVLLKLWQQTLSCFSMTMIRPVCCWRPSRVLAFNPTQHLQNELWVRPHHLTTELNLTNALVAEWEQIPAIQVPWKVFPQEWRLLAAGQYPWFWRWFDIKVFNNHMLWGCNIWEYKIFCQLFSRMTTRMFWGNALCLVKIRRGFVIWQFSLEMCSLLTPYFWIPTRLLTWVNIYIYILLYNIVVDDYIDLFALCHE